MNRIDRLLGYILTLQGGRRLTAEALAQRFEVSRRTVYRDLEALAELGVPIVATPGHGFELAPGYHLPPVMFTAGEASVLALAGALFHHFVAHDGRTALESALRKMEMVLPEETRGQVEETRRRICLTSWPHRAAPLDGELPLLVQQAMRERRRLAVIYHARSTAETMERAIDPYVLIYYAGDWHLLGFCHHRNDVRQFRLSRMESPRLLAESFEMPVEADARSFWAGSEHERRGDRVARVLFSREVIRWVRERRHYGWIEEEEVPGGLAVTVQVDRWEELLPWLLGWGGAVEVLEPSELRSRVVEEARRIVQNNHKK